MKAEEVILRELRETNELLMALAAATVYAMEDSPFRTELYKKLDRIKERGKPPSSLPPLPPVEMVTE